MGEWQVSRVTHTRITRPKEGAELVDGRDGYAYSTKDVCREDGRCNWIGGPRPTNEWERWQDFGRCLGRCTQAFAHDGPCTFELHEQTTPKLDLP